MKYFNQESVSVPSASAADEQQKPQKLHQRYGKRGDIGHSGGGQDFFRAAALLLGQQLAVFDGALNSVGRATSWNTTQVP